MAMVAGCCAGVERVTVRVFRGQEGKERGMEWGRQGVFEGEKGAHWDAIFVFLA